MESCGELSSRGPRQWSRCRHFLKKRHDLYDAPLMMISFLLVSQARRSLTSLDEERTLN